MNRRGVDLGPQFVATFRGFRILREFQTGWLEYDRFLLGNLPTFTIKINGEINYPNVDKYAINGSYGEINGKINGEIC